MSRSISATAPSLVSSGQRGLLLDGRAMEWTSVALEYNPACPAFRPT